MTLVKLTSKDLESFQRIASATKRGKTGRFDHLSKMIADMNVGDAFNIYDELSDEEKSVVLSFLDSKGNLPSKERKPIQSVVSAFQHALRKVTNNDEASITGNYGTLGENSEAAYIVTRTK